MERQVLRPPVILGVAIEGVPGPEAARVREEMSDGHGLPTLHGEVAEVP